VTPELPPEEQNQLFGDDILFAIHSAKTSAIGEGDYPVLAFTTGNTFTIDDPEPGLIRVSVNGDWTNAGRISASVSIYSLTDPVAGKTASGKIRTGQLLAFPVVVPAGTTVADFRLGWREDWGQYPTNDVDLILVRPNGTVDFGGATLSNPEHVAVHTPASGTWLVLVDGFDIATLEDKFDLRVALDGTVVT
jgi:hypothetical protein